MMRKNVILHTKMELEDLLGKKIHITEPDWQGIVEYPAIYLEMSDERVIKGINQSGTRELIINVFIIDRCLQNDTDTHYLAVLDMLQTIDDAFRRNRIQEVNDKPVTYYIERVQVQANKKATENYSLIGGAVQLKVIYSMEV